MSELIEIRFKNGDKIRRIQLDGYVKILKITMENVVIYFNPN